MISCGGAEVCEMKEGSRRLARMGSILLARAGGDDERADASERCVEEDFAVRFAATLPGADFLLFTDAGFFAADFAGAAFVFFFADVFTGVMLLLPTVCG
jgi:hypothetical protein